MQAERPPIPTRFSSLLSTASAQRAAYDQILFETQDCVICPTLGSILPDWLLVVPRTPAVHLAQWEVETGRSVKGTLSSISDEFKLRGKQIIWFEHGASNAGSSIGCGVDWAHLHILVEPPFSVSEVLEKSKEMQPLDWESRSLERLYETIDRNLSYLVVGSGDLGYLAQGVEHVGSQFLRRVIAELVGLRDAWNYRTDQHIDNVHATLRRFTSNTLLV